MDCVRGITPPATNHLLLEISRSGIQSRIKHTQRILHARDWCDRRVPHDELVAASVHDCSQQHMLPDIVDATDSGCREQSMYTFVILMYNRKRQYGRSHRACKQPVMRGELARYRSVDARSGQACEQGNAIGTAFEGGDL